LHRKRLLHGGITQSERISSFHWDGVYLDIAFRSFLQIPQAPINKQQLNVQLKVHVGTVSDPTFNCLRKLFISRCQKLQVQG
jgi:hypothetical protein